MSPITHFLASWVIFERAFTSRRDQTLVVAAGVAPDIDGIGVALDVTSQMLGLSETHYYQMFHHFLTHGLPAAIAFACLAALFAERKFRVAAAAFICVHLHYFLDILGSRGDTPDDIWGIGYLAPINMNYEIHWNGQWGLMSWQNFLITIILLTIVIIQAVRSGYSPVGVFSEKADHVFVQTLRSRLKLPAASGGGSSTVAHRSSRKAAP